VTPVERRYPPAPVVGIGAIVAMGEDSVVLVRRGRDPMAGRWSVPGGAVELGEGLRTAVAREVLEETGLLVDVGPVVEAVDHIETDEHGRIAYHFVIVDYLCTWRGGVLEPGDDVDDAVIAEVGALDPYDLAPPTVDVIRRAMDVHRRR
jgi:ADP-ribose pyrophosphatase YjhB (NUDIX family)